MIEKFERAIQIESARRQKLNGLRPFEYLSTADSGLIFELLSKEAPREAALVMTHLSAQQAADTLARYDRSERVFILRQMVRLSEPSQNALQKLSSRIEKQLAILLKDKQTDQTGVESAARLLSCTDSIMQYSLLSDLEQYDSALSDRVRDQVLAFADVLNWERVRIKQILGLVDTSLWAPALTGIQPRLKQKVLGCFARKPRELLQNEISNRSFDALIVERAQREIVRTVVELVDQGKFSLPNSDSNNKAA